VGQLQASFWNPFAASLVGLTEINAGAAESVMQGRGALARLVPMRWDQAVTYVIGALFVLGGAASVLTQPGLMIAFGCVLMAFALSDGPRGMAVLYRDVTRHIVHW
jgi:hypothetical protein